MGLVQRLTGKQAQNQSSISASSSCSPTARAMADVESIEKGSSSMGEEELDSE